LSVEAASVRLMSPSIGIIQRALTISIVDEFTLIDTAGKRLVGLIGCRLYAIDRSRVERRSVMGISCANSPFYWVE
ncbi:MAG: hypothetical protein P8I62_04680, partial [Pseudomonadales bacterium]|nr:hypothetical protein [Pseudomonadales bacterium]